MNRPYGIGKQVNNQKWQVNTLNLPIFVRLRNLLHSLRPVKPVNHISGMLLRNSIIFYMLLVCTGGVAFAQEKPDTAGVPDVYKKIEEYSSRHHFTKLIHGLLLKPVTTSLSVPAPVIDNLVDDPYLCFEGKIIRHIAITTLDPFGFSLEDTSAKPRSYVEKSGNALHLKTMNSVVRNRMLIHENDRFDSLLVKESERLIRSQSYIRDVLVTAVLTSETSDSVDVIVRVSDLWSILPDGAFSGNSFNVKLADKNLGGLGHTLSGSYSQNYLNGKNAFSGYYYVPNIKNSYISTRLSYDINENRDYIKSLVIERPFFSPVARWAGGASFSQQKQTGWIYENDTTRLYLQSRANIQDYWGAAAWQVFKGKSVTDRTTKLIISGRIFSTRYLEKPSEQPDIMDYYTNEQFFLSGLGISSRKYVEQRYIFRFGTTEDVPVGVTYGVVVGYQLKNHERWYWGVNHSWGNFFKWGYFGSHFEYGTFINASYKTEGVLKVSMNYFSGLFSIGNWKFRQFAKPEFAIGFNRPSYDRLTLNDGYGLNGFNSGLLSGTSRLLFIIQTQSYAPWNVFGFRFGPFLNFSIGMLGNATSGFQHSRMYPQFGLGVLIRNDYLVVKNVQISFAFYPSIPGQGENVFKGNPFRTTDFGFPDFIIGKPEIVDFK
jgi:hypothetical protein